MLGKKNNNDTGNIQTAINVVGEGTIISGDIQSNGDIRVDGTIEGNMTTRGKFVLGSTGEVIGNVMSTSADVSGTINGNIQVKEVLLLKTNGKVNGDITTSKLVVEAGGEFNGACNMGNSLSINATAESANGQAASA